MSNSRIKTKSGLWFDLIDPEPHMVCLEDIARGLAKTNRFCGQTDLPYSVAEHCVRMSRIVPDGLEMDALTHDIAEYVTGDMNKPLKDHPAMAAVYKPIEDRIEAVCREALGLPGKKHDSRIQIWDAIMVVTEGRDCGIPEWQLLADAAPLTDVIVPWYWAHAERKFLSRFKELSK